VACSGDKAIAPELVGSVAITSTSTTLQYGQSVQLVATVAGASGNALTGRTITWTSSNDNVATVSSSGLVTAGAVRGGTAETVTITAASEGKSAYVSVSVAPIPVSTITPSVTQASLYVGQTTQLGATLKDAAGGTLTARTITWSSSASAIASVDNQGLVTAIAPGTTTITSTAESKTTSVDITVALIPVSTVTVTPDASTLDVGQTLQLSATLKDSVGRILSGRSVTWTSITPSIAIVNGAGQVTGVSPGTSRIAVTAEGKSAIATITVNDVVATVVVSPNAATVQKGKTVQLSVTAKNANGGTIAGKTTTWSTSNSAIATVGAAGLVTVIGPGTAQIRATIDGKSDVSWISAWDTCQNEPIEIGDQRNGTLIAGACTFITARPQPSVWRLTASATAFAPRIWVGIYGAAYLWGWINYNPGIISMEMIAPLGPMSISVGAFNSTSQNGAFTFSSTLVVGDSVSCGGSVGIFAGGTAARILGARDCQTSNGQYYDIITVRLQAAESITITMKSSDFDAYLEMRNSDGTLLASNDDGAGGTNAKLRFTASSTGFYQIWARSLTAFRTGQYIIEATP
jgi:uncharacterized protein YjdB